MARTLRIDSIGIQASAVHIGVTAGSGALQPGPAKTGFSFSSRAEIVAAIQALENSFSDEQLLLLLLAIAYKQDPTLSGATASSLIGKTVALSLTSGAQLVKVT